MLALVQAEQDGEQPGGLRATKRAYPNEREVHATALLGGTHCLCRQRPRLEPREEPMQDLSHELSRERATLSAGRAGKGTAQGGERPEEVLLRPLVLASTVEGLADLALEVARCGGSQESPKAWA